MEMSAGSESLTKAVPCLGWRTIRSTLYDLVMELSVSLQIFQEIILNN